jgi:acyl dehydratase
MPPRVIEGIDALKELVGQEVGCSDWLEVTQDLIDAFAEVTHDRQWIHVDPVRARTESPNGTTIAHGFLTMGLLSRLHGQAVRVQGGFSRSINYGFNRVRFPAPVPAGARIRARSTLLAVDEVEGGVQVTWSVTIDIEGQPRPALAAEWLGRLYR